MILDRQRGATNARPVKTKTMTLSEPLSAGETLKVYAFDAAVMIEGCGDPHELQKGESAFYIATTADGARRWERVQALPGDDRA